MAVISDKHDAMIRARLSGLQPPGSDTTFLTAVKAHLDANYANFKYQGEYTEPHVTAAMNAVRNRGT